MAGVGFVLRRLVQADRLSANFQGIGHAAFVSSGPWLFTCLALVGIQRLGDPFMAREALSVFSILTAYNFSFSLVISGPIVLVVSRCLADAIYAKDVRHVSDMLLGALGLVFGVTAVVGIALYGFSIALPPVERLVGLSGLLLAAGIWVTAAFLAALKSYTSITTAFATGMAVAIAGASWLGPGQSSIGLLVSFTFGLATIFFTLVARVFAEFPGHAARPFAPSSAFRRYWELALIGIVYNAAIWVDKWIMWFAPGSISPTGGMFANPAYEGAMFLAYLSIVPSMALLLIDVETRFYTVYLRYFRDISQHATLVEIRKNHAELLQVLAGSLRRVALLQGSICLLALLLAPALIRAAGGGAEMTSIFRYGLVGAWFHVLLTMTLGALAYFDLRREVLVTALVFLSLNAGMTVGATQLGVEYHGYGYCLAAAISFAIAFYVAVVRLAGLQYLTFVSNNPTLRSPESQ